MAEQTLFALDAAAVAQLQAALRTVEKLTGRLGGLGAARRHVNQETQRGAHFAVLVWQDGGTTDGTAATQCDRTYTVRTLDATSSTAGGVLLGEAMTPEIGRPATGAMVCPPADGAGVEGVAYWGADSVVHLYDANEVRGVPVGELFAVSVTQTGGSAGTKDTACSFSYTVKDLDETELATDASPAKPRRSSGKTVAGSGYGTAFYAADKSLVLWDAGEVAAVRTDCP